MTQENETQENDNSSVVDDPDIRASLNNLSASTPRKSDIVPHPLENLKQIIEAAILAANKPLSLDKIYSLFSEQEVIDKNLIREITEQLMQDYQSRGIELVEVSSGFRFQVASTTAPWVSRLWEEKPQKYSRALLETLALVAYRQPITRGEIEEIRGVSVSSQIMRTLVEREWVRIIGHRDVPGKPAMYATTKSFLDYFGLKKLDELPSLSEIRDLDIIGAELDFGDKKEETQAASIASEEVDLFDEPDETDEESLSEAPATERIEINDALNALKETYQKLDSLENISTDEDSGES